MSLTYDPSAIRYASTQEAYGCTWTLNKIEDDGAQVWKNSQGQEAIVQKACDQVRQNHREWRLNTEDKDYGIDRINKRIGRGYTIERELGTPAASKYPPIERELGTPYDLETIARQYGIKTPLSLGHFQADPPYLKEYSETDCEVTQKLFERGFFVDWNKVDEIQTAGDSLGTRSEINAYDNRIKAAIRAKIGQNELGVITMSDSEVFDLLKDIYK